MSLPTECPRRDDVESEAENDVQAITFDAANIGGVEAVDDSVAHRQTSNHFRCQRRATVHWSDGRVQRSPDFAFVHPDIQTPKQRANARLIFQISTCCSRSTRFLRAGGGSRLKMTVVSSATPRALDARQDFRNPGRHRPIVKHDADAQRRLIQ